MFAESGPSPGDARLSQSRKGIGAGSPLESSHTKHYRHFDSASFADWRTVEAFVRLRRSGWTRRIDCNAKTPTVNEELNNVA